MGKRWNNIKKSGIKAGVVIGITLASLFGMNNQEVKGQEPSVAFRYVMNPFGQPNDSTDNYYGSGNLVDYNKRYDVNQTDVTTLENILNGSFSNPSDIRLMARADVNGDGNVTYSDKELLQEYANGTREYLPGHWNKLTLSEQKEWFEKMINISDLDKTCEGLPASVCDCNNYSLKAHISFFGLDEETIDKYNEWYPDEEYKIVNGLYNIPLLMIHTDDIGPDGIRTGGHAMNTLLIGDVFCYENLYNYDPQKGARDLEAGEEYFLFGNTGNAYILGPPSCSPFYEPLSQHYLTYHFDENKYYTLTSEILDGDQDLKVIKYRDRDVPEIEIESPKADEITNSPKLVVKITDASIVDRYIMYNVRIYEEWPGFNCYYAAWGNYYASWDKEYYNKNNSYYIDGVKSNDQVFNYTNKSLEGLSDGEHTISVTSIDEFDNETTKTVNFKVDMKNPEIFVYKPTEDSTYTEIDTEFNYKLLDANLDTKKENTHYKFNGSIGYFSNYSEGTIPISSREGENKLEIIAKDLAGNQSTKTVTYTFTPKTGIENISSEDEIIAFPIPSKGTVYFKFKNPMGEDREIELYSPSGQLVGGKKTNGELLEYDIGKYPHGFIIYRVLDENKKTIDSGKFVKE